MRDEPSDAVADVRLALGRRQERGGRVIAAPLIQVAITDGALNVTLPAGSLPIPLEALAAILASGPLPDSWRQGP